MAAGVAAVWVPGSDMQRALEFYRDMIGLEVRNQDDEWSELEANGLMIGLNARETATPSSGGGAVITFQPESDLDAEVQQLSSRGVDFVDGISEHPWGRIAAFKDSEGNDLQFYAPPA